jgi:hypothetical protein
MKHLTKIAVMMLALLVTSGSVLAQNIFKAPVFVFQPGLVTTNFLDAPDGVDSNTEFNFRVVTAVPTTIPRTTLVAIVQWTPFAEAEGTNFKTNAPGFVYGPVFSLINTNYFGLDFDLLGAYGPAAEEDDESQYTHKLVLEADAFFKIGKMMMSGSTTSRWTNLSIYAFLANVATGIPSEASNWVLLTGVSLPIAP